MVKLLTCKVNKWYFVTRPEYTKHFSQTLFNVIFTSEPLFLKETDTHSLLSLLWTPPRQAGPPLPPHSTHWRRQWRSTHLSESQLLIPGNLKTQLGLMSTLVQSIVKEEIILHKRGCKNMGEMGVILREGERGLQDISKVTFAQSRGHKN